MAVAQSLVLFVALVDEHHTIVTMFRAWLIKIFLCFSHSPHTRGKHRQKSTGHLTMARLSDETRISQDSVCHVFQPPLRVSMLGKIHYRRQLPPSTQALSYSQNCVQSLLYEHPSAIMHCKQSASLIDINKDSYQGLPNGCSLAEKAKPDKKMHTCR